MKEEEKSEWFETWFDTKYYHSLYGHRDHSEAADFIDSLLVLLGLDKGQKVMDLACGKGRHAIQLFRAGLDVVGLDLSKSSIEHLKPLEQDGLEFHQWDMRDTFRESEFNCIFNLFTSFGYFEDVSDNMKVLSAVNHGLVDNGIFVLDFLNAVPILAETKPVNKTFEKDGFHFKTSKEVRNGKVVKEIQVVDGTDTHDYQEAVQLFKQGEFEHMLNENGFEVSHVFGDYHLKAYDPLKSSRLILVAVKQ